MTKFLKISTIVILSIFIVFSVLFFTFVIITKDAVLDSNKLIKTGQNVIIYDDSGNEITSASLEAQKKSVQVKNLDSLTVNAFIASEDRTFYKHNGLNYKRMLKAFYKNAVSRSFKEGASTISQQLIKNTHLTSDKTIKRKLNEIKLTLKLEKKYSKDEILEMYLNTIYFGHNCYGLQSAAEFYFGKKAENLTLNESATIVGLLSSPNNYSPFKNPEKSLKRRNIVLNSMQECGYIDEKTNIKTQSEPINAVKTETKEKYESYLNAVFDELDEQNFDYYALSDGCIIKTYMDKNLQNNVETYPYPCDYAVIATDNITGGVKAYKSSINGAKRQPGSTVKPIFVYAPAIEEKLINPSTKILDEKIDYNGYSPENFDKSYHGYVTVTDSIKQSYNVPAVKTLNALTVKKCEKYLTAMNINLDDDEKNFSLALGGMKYGLSIKELADRYSIFPKGGNYRPSRFIKEIITKDGKTIYKNQTSENNVFSKGTCALINDMLNQTTKSGTAKKLKNFQFDLASKTGTCGNAEGNTDAYTVSYTSENCFAVWLGDSENKRLNITGGTDSCNVLKNFLEKFYDTHSPEPLDTQSGTVNVNIDREEYEQNNKTILADPLCPKLNIMQIKVLSGNEPQQQSDKFSNPTITIPVVKVENNSIKIKLCQTKYYSYIVNRTKNGQIEKIYDGKWKELITDTPEEGVYTYSIIPYFDNDINKYYGKEIIFPPIKISNKNNNDSIKIPDITQKDWFDL